MAQSSQHIKLTMTSSHLSSSGILSAPHVVYQSHGSYSIYSLLSDMINSSIPAFLVSAHSFPSSLTPFNADLPSLLVNWTTKVPLPIFLFILSSSNSFSHLLNFLNLLSDIISHLQSISSMFISQEPFPISRRITPVYIHNRTEQLTVSVPLLLTSVQVLTYVLFLPAGMSFYISVHSTPSPNFESVSHLCSVRLYLMSPPARNFPRFHQVNIIFSSNFFGRLSVLFCYSCLQMIISSRLLDLSVQTDSSGICFLWWEWYGEWKCRENT